MQLNPHQEQVANHLHGRILTLAGPGSGKTRTLTERTGRLITRSGIHPASILCLTFTNKARDEMRERLDAAYGQAASKVYISNFHGLCGTILRRMGAPLGYSARMTVCDSDDQTDLIMQVARKRGMEPTKPQARFLGMMVNDARESLADESDLEAATKGRISRSESNVLTEYLKVLRLRDQVDFSGLLSETVRLLREHPEVQTRLQIKFRFIQVDEYQDTNRAQNQIVELLADSQDNVLAVGDADQSIYEWRASPDAIKQFIANGEKKTGSCKIIKLGINYRSTPQIVGVADTLIRNCEDRIAVDFSTTRNPGELPRCARCGTPEEEAEAIGTSIAALIREGTHAREIAVFYRANDMSRLIEQALAKRQIACLVVGGGSYYDRMEVKDVLSMLRFLCNPRDGISFHRVANKPTRGMGDALIGKLESFAERNDIDLLATLDEQMLLQIRDDNDKPLTEAALKACREVRNIFGFDQTAKSVGEIANEVLDRSKYDQWLKDKYDDPEEYDTRRRNVNELVNSIVEFSRSNRRVGIADYLQSISLYTDGEAYQDDNAVRLMSLHASKGLEFDVVYMIGVEHGILPHEKAVKDRGGKGIEEERRLCYVGFTRARKVLRVTWCEKRQDAYSRGKNARFLPSAPSRFLLESGLMPREEYLDAVKLAAEARATARMGKPAPRSKKPVETK